VAVGRALIVRGDVHMVRLVPTMGTEIRKTRPCLVISPDELNQHLRTVIVAPMTTGGHAYPWRIACRFQSRSGFVVLDQLRTVDSARLVKRLGRLSIGTTTEVLERLQEMFAEQRRSAVAPNGAGAHPACLCRLHSCEAVSSNSIHMASSPVVRWRAPASRLNRRSRSSDA
jgi:mRNA interferase MazF